MAEKKELSADEKIALLTAKLAAKEEREKVLEAQIKAKGGTPAVSLKGEYLAKDGKTYFFKKNLGHNIMYSGEVVNKNDAIKNAEIMEFLIERETTLIGIKKK